MASPFNTNQRFYTTLVAAKSNLYVHWFFSAAALLCLIPYIGTTNVWSADVGAQLAQSQALANGGGWFQQHPLPQVDSTGELFPFHLSANGSDGFIVLSKHPAFSWIVAGLLKIGGFGAVMALAAVATSLAGLGVGLVVRRSGASKAVSIASLWVTSALSPLAFDAYLGYAHTVAAALAIWALLTLVTQIEADSKYHSAGIIGCALAGFAPFMRSESTLVGVSLGASLLLTSRLWAESKQQRSAQVLGVATGLATVGGYVFDRLLTVPGETIGVASTSSSWIDGRLQSFVLTWLSASYDGRRPQDFFLFFGVLVWLVSGHLLNTKANRTPGHVGVVAGSAAISLWVFVTPNQVIPGLLFAFPLLGLLYAVSTNNAIRNPAVAAAATSFVIYSGLVIATQHSNGGGAGWGGRYFAAGIPFAIVGASGGLSALLKTKTLQRSMLPAVAAGAASVLVIGSGLHNLRGSKNAVGLLESTVQTTAQTTTPGDQDPRPVVVSTIAGVGRWSWQTVPDGRWLLVEPEELTEVTDRLEQARISEITLVSHRSEDSESESIGPFTQTEIHEPWEGSQLVVSVYSLEEK